MKTTLSLLSFLALLSTASYARIIHHNDKLFVENSGNRVPLELVNTMMKEKRISKIRLYGKGSANIISFAKDGGPEKIYSVDNKGFIYSLDPFSSYKVHEVDGEGLITFKEVPNRKYRIDPKGYFLY